MERKEKLQLFFVSFVFYIPTWILVKDQINNPNYNITSIAFGAFFFLFGFISQVYIVTYDKFFAGKSLFKTILKKSVKVIGTLLMIFAGSWFVYASLFSGNESYSNNDMKFFRGTLKEKIEYVFAGKSSYNLDIKLNKYPDLIFRTQFEDYLHYNTNIESEIKVNDTLVLGIKKEEYDKHISRKTPLTYSDIHYTGNFIIPYYIESHGHVYFHVQMWNYLNKEDSKYAKFLCIFGLPCYLLIISIWHGELTRWLRRKGDSVLATRLENLRKKRIL